MQSHSKHTPCGVLSYAHLPGSNIFDQHKHAEDFMGIRELPKTEGM